MHFQTLDGIVDLFPSRFHLETKSNEISGVLDKHEFASENGLVSM